MAHAYEEPTMNSESLSDGIKWEIANGLKRISFLVALEAMVFVFGTTQRAAVDRFRFTHCASGCLWDVFNDRTEKVYLVDMKSMISWANSFR